MKTYTIKYWTNGFIVQFYPSLDAKISWLHICFKKEIITTRDIPQEELRGISRLIIPDEYHSTLGKVIFQHMLFPKDCHEISFNNGFHDVEEFYKDKVEEKK